MAAYEFVALDQRGREQKGVLEADSVRQIRQQLRDRGWAPLTVDTASGRTASGGEAPAGRTAGLRRGLAALDLAMITRHLSTLVGSGLPIEEALHAASEQAQKSRVQSMLLAVRARVLEGYPLAAALGEFPSAFSSLYRSTVAAGEASGHLDEVLRNLADYTERRQSSRQNVHLALLYPIILVTVSLAIVVALLTYVVPKIVAVYADSARDLPLLTRMLIDLSAFLQTWGLALLVALALAAFGVQRLLRQPRFQRRWHRTLLHAPVTRPIVRGSNASQFASTLSILAASGVPLVDAMRIAGEVIPNVYLRERVAEATRRVAEGESLRVALEGVGYFPPLMLHMVGSGEASGELDAMLARVAAHMEQDLERLISVSLELFKPLMLLLMGGLVLLIVLAILLPILNLNQVAI